MFHFLNTEPWRNAIQRRRYIGSRSPSYRNCMDALYQPQTHLNFPKTIKKPPTSITKGVRNVNVTLRMRILETYNFRAAEAKQHFIQDAFSNHGTEYRRRGLHRVGQYCNEYERPPVELAWARIAHGRGQISTKSTSELCKTREGVIIR